MTNLIERLEAATGPDREIGHAVLLACGWTRRTYGSFYGPLYWWSPPGLGRGYDEDRLPCPTADLNAALALVGEKLPGWHWKSGYNPHVEPGDRYLFDIERPSGADWVRFEASAPTPALAVLIALLKALGDQHD